MEEELEREVRLYRQKSQGKLNVKSEVPKGENSTMVSESESLLLKAVKNQDLQFVEKLLKEENIDPNSPNNQPFMYSLRYSLDRISILFAKDSRTEVSFRDNFALHTAINDLDIHLIKLLLDHPKFQDLDGFALIQGAVATDNYEIIDLLLDDDRIYFMDPDNRLLRAAIINKNLDIIKRLLSDRRIHPGNNDDVILNRGVLTKDVEIVKTLLDDARISPRGISRSVLCTAKDIDEKEITAILESLY